MILKIALFAVIFSSLIYSGHPITIDGLYDDWTAVDISYSDSQGDGADADFADVKITYDNDFLFIYLLSRWIAIYIPFDYFDFRISTVRVFCFYLSAL